MDSMLNKWDKIKEIYDNFSNNKDKNKISEGKKNLKKYEEWLNEANNTIMKAKQTLKLQAIGDFKFLIWKSISLNLNKLKRRKYNSGILIHNSYLSMLLKVFQIDSSKWAIRVKIKSILDKDYFIQLRQKSMKGYKLAEKFPVIFKSDGMLHEINQIIKEKNQKNLSKKLELKFFIWTERDDIEVFVKQSNRMILEKLHEIYDDSD